MEHIDHRPHPTLRGYIERGMWRPCRTQGLIRFSNELPIGLASGAMRLKWVRQEAPGKKSDVCPKGLLEACTHWNSLCQLRVNDTNLDIDYQVCVWAIRDVDSRIILQRFNTTTSRREQE